MKKALVLFRDPIWQMIGVMVAILAIFISGSKSDTGLKELVSVHFRQGGLMDELFPGSSTEVLIEGINYKSELVVADYFLLLNQSSSAISPSDFVSRIMVRSRQNAAVLRADSCSKSYAQVCSSDGATTPVGGAYIYTDWKLTEGTWSADGPLINKDDAACIVVLSEPKGEYKRGSPLAEISARVKGYNFKFYENTEAFLDARKRWFHGFHTVIHFEGMAPYWLFFLAGTLMVVSLRLLYLSGRFSRPPFLQTFAQCVVVLLCVSTSEILTDVYINRGGNFLYLHFIAWPLLVLHLGVLSYLVVAAFRAGSQPNIE